MGDGWTGTGLENTYAWSLSRLLCPRSERRGEEAARKGR